MLAPRLSEYLRTVARLRLRSPAQGPMALPIPGPPFR
jgi:hypothetical protein